MAKYRKFIRKYYIPISIGSFVFIGLPQYIDSLWSLYDKVREVNETGLNITWLYLITIPVGLGMLSYIIWLVSRVTVEESKTKWEHYNKLTDLILSMEVEPHENWAGLVADMHRELNAIGDKTINRYMRLYFPVLDEEEHVGIKPSRAVSQKMIDLTREHMIRKYRRY